MQYFLTTAASKIAGAVFFILVFLIPAFNANAKIQIHKDVDPVTAERFVNDLRQKTGLENLTLDGKNFLVLRGTPETHEGSKTMRRLILGAIDDSENTFVIESRSGSKAIHFSQTDQGTVDIETQKTTYLVRFDFDDFKKSRRYSSDEALGSFSFGINLFHEIDHKVSYDKNDPIPPSGVRPDKSTQNHRGVIEKTNLVRRELGLIPRDSKTRFGLRYKGLVSLFRNTFQILFRDKKGKRKFVRWKGV